MQTTVNCRVRTVFLSLLAICLVFIGYLIWPWCYASWMWQNSTIHDSSHSILNTSHMLVPRILHQTWRDDTTVPRDWQKASNSCRSYHSNYEYRLWTDKTARQLIEKEFPSLLSTYDSYPYDIQRADVIRLVVLYVYGGIYLDLDIVCLKSFDFLRQYEFVLPRTMPVGLSNDFILATPKHPFLYQILTDLPKFNRRILTKYSTVMFTTGPMFLTFEASHYSNRSSIDVLSPELYGKYVFNSTIALFRHLKASSWHGNDAALIKWVYHRRIFCLLLASILLILIFTLIYFIQHYQLLMHLLKDISSLGKLETHKQLYKYDKLHSIST